MNSDLNVHTEVVKHPWDHCQDNKIQIEVTYEQKNQIWTTFVCSVNVA